MTTSVSIIGNTGARGGATMMYAGVHPEADGQQVIIETSSHKFDKGSGYRVDISAKTKIPNAGGSSGGTSAGGDYSDIA
ncbi:MAG TPA: hypothetical protein PKE16_19605 [Hyphomicrobium sp.]|nr:hypothetical protein [Hyphomicrobium sp.]